MLIAYCVTLSDFVNDISDTKKDIGYSDTISSLRPTVTLFHIPNDVTVTDIDCISDKGFMIVLRAVMPHAGQDNTSSKNVFFLYIHASLQIWAIPDEEDYQRLHEYRVLSIISLHIN